MYLCPHMLVLAAMLHNSSVLARELPHSREAWMVYNEEERGKRTIFLNLHKNYLFSILYMPCTVLDGGGNVSEMEDQITEWCVS